MNAIYEYTITYFDETEEKRMTASGLVCGDSYGAAMTVLASYYGDENVISACLSCFDTDIVECDTETILTIKESLA